MQTTNLTVSDHYFSDWLMSGVIVTVAIDNNKRCVYFPPFISDEYLVQALVKYNELNIDCKRATVHMWEFLCKRVEELGVPYSHLIL